MRFRIWQSSDYAITAMGYKPNAEMACVWDASGVEHDLHDTDGSMKILGRIFHDFQRVDENHMPPEEYKGRSLSVGDVVQIERDTGATEWWAVEPVGWKEIEGIHP